MKRAILIAAVDPSIGGVLVFGDRGTGKSTAVRGLAALLPRMRAVAACRYGCDPKNLENLCEECQALRGNEVARRLLQTFVLERLARQDFTGAVKVRTWVGGVGLGGG